MNLSNKKSQVMQSICGHISGGANVDTHLPPPTLPQIMVLKEANS